VVSHTPVAAPPPAPPPSRMQFAVLRHWTQRDAELQ
jgi:hypothetical protein